MRNYKLNSILNQNQSMMEMTDFLEGTLRIPVQLKIFQKKMKYLSLLWVDYFTEC